MTKTRKLGLIAVLAANILTGCFAAGAAGQQGSGKRASTSKCLSSDEIRTALGNASELMAQSRFQDVVGLLKPISSHDCDPRISLLLAAALESSGDVPAADQELERAHSVWPDNNSIAASLARDYMGRREISKAASALAHFHPTPATPQQELEEAVLVYLAAQRLVAAQSTAEVAYKAYPSIQTLLMLANTLQLQGRYPDVNRLLDGKRSAYSDSAEFLITLAESEFDAGLYPAARDDLQRSIAINSNIYQAHYLLGNAWSKLNNTEQALAEYQVAIRLAPNQPRTYYQMALVLRSKQDQDEEQHALEQALSADDHYAPAHCELGRILLESHHPDEALPHLNAAVEGNPRSEEAYFLLSRAYAVLGQKDKSADMVKRLQELRKSNRPSSASPPNPVSQLN